jgi:small-conductance mechanosensitive channel
VIDRPLLLYSFFLILAIPAIVVILGEAIERLRNHHHPLARPLAIVRVLLLPALVIWLHFGRLFPVNPLAGNWIASLVGIAIAYTALSFINVLLTAGKKQYSWQIAVPNLLFQVTRVSIVLVILAYFLARVWQVDLVRLLGALGVGSLVIALALQDSLSNLFSGFLLIIESPFKVGDWIKVGNIQGEVIEINWRAVRIRTNEGDIVIVPNGNLGKETICNYSAIDPSHAIRVMMKFSYAERPHRIESILQEVALSIEGILPEPLPQIEPKHFHNSSIDYEVKFFITDFAHAERIEGDFLKRAYYATRRHNFQQPFADKIEYKMDELPVQNGRSAEEVGDFLQSLPIFARIDHSSLDYLARASRVKEFGRGEEIVRVGDLAGGFCLVRSGTVSLSTRDRRGESREIARLSSGDFFGEMSLVGDEASRVSVVAISEVEIIEIAAAALAISLDRYPHFAHLVGQLIEERTKAIRLVRGTARSGQSPARIEAPPLGQESGVGSEGVSRRKPPL